eukprot:203620-Pyramimonas_sp.AAC.1
MDGHGGHRVIQRLPVQMPQKPPKEGRLRRVMLYVLLCVWAITAYMASGLLFTRQRLVVPERTHEDLKRDLEKEIQTLKTRPDISKAIPLVYVVNEGIQSDLIEEIENANLGSKAQEEPATDNPEDVMEEVEDTTGARDSIENDENDENDGVSSTATENSEKNKVDDNNQ